VYDGVFHSKFALHAFVFVYLLFLVVKYGTRGCMWILHFSLNHMHKTHLLHVHLTE